MSHAPFAAGQRVTVVLPDSRNRGRLGVVTSCVGPHDLPRRGNRPGERAALSPGLVFVRLDGWEHSVPYYPDHLRRSETP